MDGKESHDYKPLGTEKITVKPRPHKGSGMQRRAATLYVVLFLVIAVGAIAVISVAEEPDPAMDEYDFQVPVDSTFEIDGTTYTVARIDDFSTSIQWTSTPTEQSTTWLNESEIAHENSTYRVEIPPESQPGSFALQELFPDHDANTTEVDGETYVVIEEDDGMRLVPEEEYLRDRFGPRERLELEAGDTIYWDGENATVTIEEITQQNVAVSWVGPMSRSASFTEGVPNTLAGEEYVANLVGTDYIQLTTDMEAYEDHADRLDTYDERHSGFWGLSVISVIAAVLVGGLSFLPRRR